MCSLKININRFMTRNPRANWTGEGSELLKRVNLKVSKKKFKHKKMFGTDIEGPANSNKGERQDMCEGDNGGPLMLPVTANKWVIIGWLQLKYKNAREDGCSTMMRFK